MRARPLLAAALVTGVTAAALTTTTTSATAADPWLPALRTSAPDELPSFEVATRLPKMPRALPVLDVQPDGIAAAEVARGIAGIDGEPLKEADGVRVMHAAGEGREKRQLVEFAASGAFDFRTATRFANPRTTPRLPDDGEAIEKARDLLAEIATTVSDRELELAEVTHSVMVERDAEKGVELQRFATDVEVRVPQLVTTEFGEFPVTGPSSKLYVAFGDGGELVGITRTRMALAPSRTMLETIQPEDAIALLAKGVGVLDLPRECATATVVDIDAVYWVGTPRVAQPGAVPLYEVDVQCTSAKGEDLGVHDAFAPAVRGAGAHVDRGLDGPDGEQPPTKR